MHLSPQQCGSLPFSPGLAVPGLERISLVQCELHFFFGPVWFDCAWLGMSARAALARLGTQDDRRGTGPACPGVVGRLSATARAARPSGSPPPVPCHSLLSLGSSVVAAGSQQVGRVQRRCRRRSVDSRRSRGGPEHLHSVALSPLLSTESWLSRGHIPLLNCQSEAGEKAPPGPTTSPKKGPVRAARPPRLPCRWGGCPSFLAAIAGNWGRARLQTLRPPLLTWPYRLAAQPTGLACAAAAQLCRREPPRVCLRHRRAPESPRLQPGWSGSDVSPRSPLVVPDEPNAVRSSSSSRPPCLVAWPCPHVLP
ncbi:hypothetical protein NDU88_003290 [Pleurodeles waltl]|uniref:Uncharacterized protein n=1 Tax=Pleurodeles waltl TaxID=8319 RepID=A0AAV7P973_PLEWA|nr:hypothetical protein NDU88_003290 [Pleurodeles waltl]